MAAHDPPLLSGAPDDSINESQKKKRHKNSEDRASNRAEQDRLWAWMQAISAEYARTDPRSLGLFRIAFGIFLLVDLYRRLPDYVFFYTNEGMLPNHGALYWPMSSYLFSLYHAFSSPPEVLFAFALTALVYVGYLVGYKTKLCQILVLVLVTSLHSRNIMLENGGDVVCNILALWTAFLPLGKRFSFDALLASFRNTKEQSPDELNDRSHPMASRTPVVSLAYAAIVLNCAIIYYFNAIHKDGYTWREGTTVHFVLWADRLVQPLGVWVRSWVPLWTIKAMTKGTLIMESSIVVYLLSPVWIRPCRRVAALTIIALHSGFQSLGHFGLFSFVMMLHAVLLLGPEDWEALAQRMRKRLPDRVVFYDASCGFCFQCVRLLKRLDHLAKISFVPNQRTELLPPRVEPSVIAESIIVTTAEGHPVWLRSAAVAELLRALPYGIVLTRILQWPGIRSLADNVYHSIATRRDRISAGLGYAVCGLPPPSSSSRGGAGAPPGSEYGVVGRLPYALLDQDSSPRGVRVWFQRWVISSRELLVAIFILALGTQALVENRKAPALLKPRNPSPMLLAIAQYPRFFQGWSMFAPIPPMDDGKVVVDATTVDGRHIDPLTGGKPVDWALGAAHEGMLMSQFWYEFHERVHRDANTHYRDYFRDWVLHWDTIEHRPPNDKIVAFEAWWVSRPAPAPGVRTPTETKRQRFMQASSGQGPQPMQGPARPLRSRWSLSLYRCSVLFLPHPRRSDNALCKRAHRLYHPDGFHTSKLRAGTSKLQAWTIEASGLDYRSFRLGRRSFRLGLSKLGAWTIKALNEFHHSLRCTS